MHKEAVLTHASLVLADQVLSGSLVMEDGKIREIDADSGLGISGTDCSGDYIIPGLIEIHTDNLEKHLVPRPGIYWPSVASAIIAHDNQVFNSGITTVLDAVALGFSDEDEMRNQIMDASIQAVKDACRLQLLRADHFLHLRCEIASATVFDLFHPHAHEALLKLVSVMDHTPGQRQWRDLSKWRLYHKDKKWTDMEAQAVIDHRRNLQETYGSENRKQILKACRESKIPVASHDDTTPRHCLQAWESGITISEFPTTLEAAAKAKELNMDVIMGAPNMVRGESHSGNISAQDLAARSLLDGFSSDYMPISLLQAAFILHEKLGAPLPASIATVTANIAKMVHLDDRGVIAAGKKADMVRIQIINGQPVVKSIWKNGNLILSSQ